MRNTSALSRLVAPMIAVGILVAGCGQAPPPAPPTSAPRRPAASQARPPPSRRGARRSRWPQARTATGSAQATPGGMPAGSVYRNPASGRYEVVVEDIARTAVLIGDSQSEPGFSWPRTALASLGYKSTSAAGAAPDLSPPTAQPATTSTPWSAATGSSPRIAAPLCCHRGGGNDASRGATDEQISANAERLIASVRQRYPAARLAMVGTLARGVDDGGGRRTEVDALLGTVAARHSIPFVGVGDWLTRHNLTKLMADGVHMAPEVTRPWACCWQAAGRLRVRGRPEPGRRSPRLTAESGPPGGSLSRWIPAWARMAPSPAPPCVR